MRAGGEEEKEKEKENGAGGRWNMELAGAPKGRARLGKVKREERPMDTATSEKRPLFPSDTRLRSPLGYKQNAASSGAFFLHRSRVWRAAGHTWAGQRGW